MAVEWQWGYYGACFVNNTLLCSVKIGAQDDGTYHISFWDDLNEKGGSTGLLLDCVDENFKSLKEVMIYVEDLAEDLASTKETLKQRKRRLKEYPFHD